MEVVRTPPQVVTRVLAKSDLGRLCGPGRILGALAAEVRVGDRGYVEIWAT